MRFANDYHRLRVIDVIDETRDTKSFVLAIPSDLGERFAYSAGQFCTFRATIGGEMVARCYSMSSAPAMREPFTVTVKRVPDGRMSNWMNDRLTPGDTIEVMPPAGRFLLRPMPTPIVAFAGGSGITPIFSILKTALATTTRELLLVYASRTAESIIFAKAIESIRAASRGRLTVHHHLDSGGAFLDATACARLVGGRVGGDFYVCGPAPFLDVVEAGLDQRGVDADRRFIERFQVSDGVSGAAEETPTTVRLEIRVGGRRCRVDQTGDDTILETARRAGLKPPFACQAGGCGTCMAFLERGAVTMRVNNILSADEVAEGWILTCQAIPRTPEIVVDYDH